MNNKFSLHEDTDMSQLSDVEYIGTCECDCQFLESHGIPSNDGQLFCSQECADFWDGKITLKDHNKIHGCKKGIKGIDYHK